MKIFDVPATHHDMVYSVSLTGITKLTVSRFKTRHNKIKEVEQVPRKGFQIPVKIKKERTRSRRKKIAKPRTTRIQQYVINKKEVTHRIRNYVNQMKGEKMLYFWTISFPEKTTDHTAHILLNKWLTRLRKERMIKEYLWISERQQNGTIHFHMTINRKMNVQKANKFMRASIMHSINTGEIEYSRERALKYNGVDIAKDRKTKRVINFAKKDKQKALTNYLTKYITKNEEKFSHLAWHSSREYSNLIISVRFTESEILNSNILSMVNEKVPFESEYYIFFKWKGEPPKSLQSYLANINSHIQSLLNL